MCLIFLGEILVCAYIIYQYGQNFYLLHNSQWITIPTLLFLVFHSFCAKLLYIVILLLLLFKLFTSANADGLSQKIEWQQVSSRLQEPFSVFWPIFAMLLFGWSLLDLKFLKFYSFYQHPEIVPSAPLTVGITVTFLFHSFFSSLARSKYLSLFTVLWFSLSDPPRWQSPLFDRFSFFFFF